MTLLNLRGRAIVLESLAALQRQKPFEREPYTPTRESWREDFDLICRHCEHIGRCDVVEAMIEMQEGGPWPAGGWVTDPGAGITCLSYEPRRRSALLRQQRRTIERMSEASLPPVCGGCAARKGSEASVALHTQRDFAASVRDRAPFVCHEDPAKEQLCGGWCRAMQRKAR